MRPEFIVILDVGDGSLYRPDAALVSARSLKLRHRFLCEVLQLDPIGLRRLGQRGRRDVDRDGRGSADADQVKDLGTGWQINVKQSYLLMKIRQMAEYTDT